MTWGFRALVDPEAEGTTMLRVEAQGTTPVEDVVMRLLECFEAEPENVRIELVIDGALLGLVTMRRLRELSPPIREPGNPGYGDGATLPGPSSQYKQLTYLCCSCDTKKKVMFADEPPECPEHGPMDRVS